MENLNNYWAILVSSANKVLTHGVEFLREGDIRSLDGYPEKKRKVIQLHNYIHNLKKGLEDLDNELWNILTAKTDSQNMVTSKSGYLLPSDVNDLGIIRDRTDKLNRRYEGLPYPQSAIVYNEEDRKRDAVLFQSFFPVETNEKITSKATHSTKEIKPTSELNYADVVNTSHSGTSQQRPKPSLSLGQPRKPRLSKPDPYHQATKVQEEILNRVSALALPKQKRKSLDQSVFDGETKNKREKLTHKEPNKKKQQMDDPNSKDRRQVTKPGTSRIDKSQSPGISTKKGSPLRSSPRFIKPLLPSSQNCQSNLGK